MRVTKTAKLKILNKSQSLQPTVEIYRKALSFYIDVAYKEWNAIKDIDDSNRQVNYLESVTHKTAKNPKPLYDFDRDFYKFPSYLRRACIKEGIGYVKAFFSSVTRYEEEKVEVLSKGKKFKKKPPTLQTTHNSFPVFYKPVMFEKQSDSEVKIKAYINNDWVWIDLKLAVIRKTLQKARLLGIRVAKVLARGTSQYAFDGSGEFDRNNESGKRDTCKFTTGKKYHCDLGASYNIAARFFIRILLKPLPETVRLQLRAKVPETAARHQQTLASLIRLHEALSLAA